MFDYIYGDKSRHFNFIRLPQVLFTDELFRPLSSDTKILYALLLDRTGLSIKKHWLDSEGRVYINFPISEISEKIGVGTQKAVKLMRELENFGLIERVRIGLGKEFIMQNPPDFTISNKCCEYAKKKPAKRILKKYDADLEITGIRKSEGGIRSANYKTCFSENKEKNCDTYRPVFWYTDSDKKEYEQHFGIVHSRCYTEYGMKRTGCAGCPFNPRITEELSVIKEYEPKLYRAAMFVFGKSYDYTRKYREFQKMMNEKQKNET